MCARRTVRQFADSSRSTALLTKPIPEPVPWVPQDILARSRHASVFSCSYHLPKLIQTRRTWRRR
ncbi:hypothetical protein BD311DRAFT_764157, partial [Dichomitus squalens]